MQVRKMRLLRMRYDISCVELGRACGLSPQRISELEFGDGGVEPVTEGKIQTGFLKVIAQRTERLCSLTQTLLYHQDSLMISVEENGYEL